MSNIQVIKIDGRSEPYSEDKIRTSATRVGVPGPLQDAMIKEIRSKLYDGIKTTEIYDIIRSYLSKSGEPYLATRYNLKSALAQLGPSGYPFEQYLAQLLEEHGYTVKTNQVLEGSCISHEIDVLAKKADTTYFVEAKFHSKPAQRSDVKVALYIRARYEDLAQVNSNNTMAWIITNTRFSSQVTKYATCRNIKLTSWSYPNGQGIANLVESVGLHPITILEGLTREDLRLLFSQNIVTCRQLIGDKQVASLIPSGKRRKILAQAESICQG